MSSTAPWLALACDWHESEMFIGATAGQKLAWVAMLCFSKSRGRAGVFTLRRHALCQEFSLEPSDVDAMLDRAVEHGAASVEGDVVTLTGWRTYQDPSQRRGSLVKDGGFTKKSATTLTTPTKHPSPSTSSKKEPPLPPCLDTDAFRTAWTEYTTYRREAKHSPLKPRSIAAKWKELAEHGHDEAIAAIGRSIANGWTGVFPGTRQSGSGAGRQDAAARRAAKESREYGDESGEARLL